MLACVVGFLAAFPPEAFPNQTSRQADSRHGKHFEKNIHRKPKLLRGKRVLSSIRNTPATQKDKEAHHRYSEWLMRTLAKRAFNLNNSRTRERIERLKGSSRDWKRVFDTCPDVWQKNGFVVLGLGHSGTSSVACSLFAAFYDRKNRNRLCETDLCVTIDERFVSEFSLSRKIFKHSSEIDSFVNATRNVSLKRYWHDIDKFHPLQVIKDPRFIWTLHKWVQFWLPNKLPVLIYVVRNERRVMKSYLNRNEFMTPELLRSRSLWASWQNEHWATTCKVKVDVHSLMGNRSYNHHEPSNDSLNLRRKHVSRWSTRKI